MKTIIKTKELLKLINPIKDGVTYKHQLIKIDMELLQKYVEQPSSNNIYDNINTDDITSLHKNLALYIINAPDTPKLISIDLNVSTPIQSGMFELIKNIYNKEELTRLDIKEHGNNEKFIKSKKLVEQVDDSIENAVDTFLASSENIFLDLEPDSTLKAMINTHDVYSNKEFVISKVKELRDMNMPQFTQSFFQILELTDKKLLESEEFKLAILNLNNKNLITLLAEGKLSDKFPVDFSTPTFQDFLMNQVNEEKFTIIELFFAKYIKEKRAYDNNYFSKTKPEFKSQIPIDFKLLVNQEKTVEYLINKYYGFASESFSLVNCYDLLNDDLKCDKKIVDKYLKCIIDKDGQEERIDNHLLFKLPISLFNDKDFITRIINPVNLQSLSEFFKKNDFNSTILKDKELILSLAHTFHPWRLTQWISYFFDKNEITKDFVVSLIKNKPSFYEQIKQKENFEEFYGDLDLMQTAVKVGYPIKDIKWEQISPHLLTDGTVEEENFKVNYVIAIKSAFINSYQDYSDKKDIEIFKKKYTRPEYLYLNTDKYYYHTKERAKILKKIKSLPDIMSVIEKMDNSSLSYNIDVNSFYRDLNPVLKNNKTVVNKLLELGEFSYENLTERLKCSSDMVIAFINASTKSINTIPEHLFNDVNFSLEFAKLMDKGIYQHEKRLIPSFILKFYDNHGVKKDFHDYLKTYINVKNLNAELTAQKEVKPAAKRAKL